MTRFPANPMQSSFILGDITFLIGLQFQPGYKIQNALNFFQKALIPLRLKYENGYFIPQNTSPSIHHIQNFKSIREASDFVDLNVRPRFNQELGLMAYNDNQLILHLNHAACDGTFVKFLINNFENQATIQKVPQFLEDDFVVFKNEIANAPKTPPFFSNPLVLRTFQKLKPNANKDRVSHQICLIPANQFKLYDPIKNGPVKFTESMWLSVYFATCLHRNEFLKSIAVPTVCETRKWLSHPPNLSNGNHDSVVIPSIAQINENLTIEEIGKMLRNDMNERFKRNEQFSYLKQLITPPSKNPEPPLPGNIWSTSSVGPLTLKQPIEDIWMNTSGKAMKNGSLCLLTYSICQPEKKRNDVVLNLQYDENVWNEKEAKRMIDIFEYFYTKVSHKKKVKDVFDEMKTRFPPL